ncbi:MAG: fused MFS/spermidine synthase [Minisyncoccia bacterium]
MSEHKIILSIAFVSGMAITAMEISASRLLAPYFGTSLFVWTNIISVVLLALSIGYYFGGKMSEKNPDLSFLFRIILSAGLLCIFSPLLIQLLLITLVVVLPSSISLFIILGSLLFSIILFGVPLVLLGMTSPFLIKIATINEEKVGDISGKIFAFSTIGSLFGTFLPTFIFIPFLGTKITIMFFSGILIVLGSFGLKRKWFFVTTAVIIAMLFSPLKILEPVDKILAEKDSFYQFIQIKEKNGIRHLSTDGGLGIQSIYNPKQVTTGEYYDSFMLLPYLFNKKDPVNVLIIGLAGGTIARGLYSEFGTRVRMDGVEIDPKIIELSKKYLDLESIPINIYETDGRVFLQSSSKKYDVIIVDAYQNEFHVPWTMTTKEFWQTTLQHLTEKGIVAINVISPNRKSLLIEAITNTISSVLSYTIVAHPGDNNNFNYFVIGSKNKIETALLKNAHNLELAKTGEKIINSAEIVTFEPQERILTDDKAPVEFLTDTTFLNYF